MVRVFAVLCVLLLGACSPAEDAGTPVPAKGAAPTSVLDKITPERLCDLVSIASIKQAVGVAPLSAESRRSGKPPLTTTYTCVYGKGLPGFTTALSTTERDKTDQQVLDHAFVDYARSETKPIDFDPVPGVGVLAGYGPDPSLSNVDLNGHQLAVVFRIDQDRLLLVVSVFGDTAVDKLKPAAAELMKNLDAAT